MSGGNSNSNGTVVRHGYLRKLKTMKRKYFVLRAETLDCSARLEYYESEKKFRAGATPRRVIPLKSCFNITRRLDLKQKHVIALYTKEEQFCVVAEGEEDLYAWLTDILKQHRSEDTAEELLHPTQHIWQVNVQKKGLGASKNIIGLYNLCLTDKTLSLVKIKPNNNVIGEFAGVTERLEFYLRNIRRCGDSECFFYMEVGRQTATGSGELWMHTDDANIAQSMHSTILHAMSNCKDDKDTTTGQRDRSSSFNENRSHPQGLRRQTFTTGQNRLNAVPNENQPPNTITKTDDYNPMRVIKHHRTVSLPTGCPNFSDTLKIVHERTRSAPLTGDEVDRAIIEKATRHSSCKAVNGHDTVAKKTPHWCRRASTGTRLSKLSPAHTKNTLQVRNRSDSMPSRTCPPIDTDKIMIMRHPSDNVDGFGDISRDEIDASIEWHRTPRIPEESSDYCDMTRDIMSGYREGSSCGSVCSGTPSTDARFMEYPLEPVPALIGSEGVRSLRAYSVGSRPGAGSGSGLGPGSGPGPGLGSSGAQSRVRAYSVGARRDRPCSSAPHLPRNSTDDLMEIDFTHNHSPKTKVIIARTPPSAGFTQPPKYGTLRYDRTKVDEYVDMSPQSSSYVEMKPDANMSIIATSPPNKSIAALSKSPPKAVTTPDGYVPMNYGKSINRYDITMNTSTPSRPISIGQRIEPNTHTDDIIKRLFSKNITPTENQTIFPLSPESPMTPRQDKHDLEVADVFDEELNALTIAKESDDVKSPEIGSPPHYVTIARTFSQPIVAPTKLSDPDGDELSRNPTATKTWAGDNNVKSRLNEHRKSASPAPEVAQLNYAALDLKPKAAITTNPPRAYTQIDFARSEKLNTADNC